MNQRHGWRQNNRRRRSIMSSEERELYRKYALKSMEHHMQSTREESEAYNLAWEHAMEFVNELITLRNRKQLEQMSDEEFNAFLRNQLGSQN